MKRLIVFAMLGFAAMSVTPAHAQVSVNINIGAQPDWGPRGYNHVDYYYLPEVESYYYVPTRQFIYYSGNRWVHNRNLPSRYRNYDLHKGRKVVINSNRPYLRHQNYKKRYSSNYSSNRPQKVVYRSSYNEHDSKNYRKQEKSSNKGNKHERGGNNGKGKDNHGNNGRH
ncbi:hypothetical protein AAKU52_001240 [Pedobacter sp. CG_S7]|uniref:hypothetical protein n=1 Tax=Pedobacter sp. CG_S7 TaxID=3143930 RepID=UPI00339786B1